MERDTSLKTKILTVLNGSIYITPALTDLEENTHYEISVRANTIVGAGPWTNLTVHTPEDGQLNICTILSDILVILLFDDKLISTICIFHLKYIPNYFRSISATKLAMEISFLNFNKYFKIDTSVL